jgi:hypothetical protein
MHKHHKRSTNQSSRWGLGTSNTVMFHSDTRFQIQSAKYPYNKSSDCAFRSKYYLLLRMFMALSIRQKLILRTPTLQCLQCQTYTHPNIHQP